VEVASATTIGEVLKGLEDQFPQVTEQLYDKKGELKDIFDVYINGKGINPVTLGAKVQDGDEVAITMFFCFPRSGK
jgi:molybdopterin converting factor small subunit